MCTFPSLAETNITKKVNIPWITQSYSKAHCLWVTEVSSKHAKVRKSKSYVSSWKLLLPLINICCFSLRNKDAHKTKPYTMLSFIKLCTVFGYILETLSNPWPGDVDKKGIATFLRALFTFILTEKLQPLPHSSCPGPTHYLWGCAGGDCARKWKGKRGGKEISRAAALAWLSISCAWQPSDGLSYGQQELESTVWAKTKWTGLLLCIAGFGQSILYLRKVPVWNMPTTNEAKQNIRCRICDAPFWPASLLLGFAEMRRPWQNCCNWCTHENRDAINSQTELEVEETSELGFFYCYLRWTEY